MSLTTQWAHEPRDSLLADVRSQLQPGCTTIRASGTRPARMTSRFSFLGTLLSRCSVDARPSLGHSSLLERFPLGFTRNVRPGDPYASRR
jgi:hypothetical protein